MCWKIYLNNTTDLFWEKWKKEYLLELRECHHHVKGAHTTCDPVVIGDIDLDYDQGELNTFW